MRLMRYSDNQIRQNWKVEAKRTIQYSNDKDWKKTMAAEIKPDISIKQLKKIFPELDELLLKIGRSEIVKVISSMPKSGNYALGNASRVAGLTEIEIGLLVDELNERRDIGKVRRRIVPKVRFKAGTKNAKRKAS